MTKEEYIAKTKRIPPSLFSHNVQQRSAQSVHPQREAAKGVIGRMMHALSSLPSPFSTAAYSISGNTRILEGERPPEIISASEGVIRLGSHAERRADLNKMLTRNKTSSLFAQV